MIRKRTVSSRDFKRALTFGRPPNITKLFPNSKALIVSGRYIDQAMIAKTKSVAIACNGRSYFVIRGALKAAQMANSPLIIEIAKSEGGRNAYCSINYWNMARYVDTLMNEMGITVPVAVHADHYGIKSVKDMEDAKIEIPTLFELGITSIAIDASHLPDDANLLANIELSPLIPFWSGLETEIGEIKGNLGLSTEAEALFLIRGLNAHCIFPDWIALNNGTTHGIESNSGGIDVDLTARLHRSLSPFAVSGAQHGTSGNNSEKLKAITQQTRTTKANVATALQMISWGLTVNDDGNAMIDENGHFIKEQDKGMSDTLWKEIIDYTEKNKITANDFKKLNIVFENKLMSQASHIRERMAGNVSDFVFHLMTEVFNAKDSAPFAINLILEKESFDPGPKAEQIEKAEHWTQALIREKAKTLSPNKGPTGDFDD